MNLADEMRRAAHDWARAHRYAFWCGVLIGVCVGLALGRIL